MKVTNKKTVLIKLSGEALGGASGVGVDTKVLSEIANEIASLANKGVRIGVVIGGGNYFRGRSSQDMDRPTADNIGMLATIMNSLTMKAAIEANGGCARVMNSLAIPKVCELVNAEKARALLSKGVVVIFSGGTGNPFCTTDLAAVLRAAEISADVALFAKNIDGVYSADPKDDATATRIDKLTYDEILAKNLQAIDGAAAATARDVGLQIVMFKLEKGNIEKAVSGESIGTLITK
jgi:uridylate kinase